MWNKELKINQVDKIIADTGSQRTVARPRRGWLHLVRTALDMSTRALAERVGLSQPRISLIEKGEIDGSLTLNTLEKVADGLGCELVYYLVPKEGKTLEQLRKDQAERKADWINNYSEIQMRLEEQPTEYGFQAANKDRLRDELLREWRRDFWDMK